MDYSPQVEAMRPWQLAFSSNEVWSCPHCEQVLALDTEFPEYCWSCQLELHNSLPHDIGHRSAKVRVSVLASEAHLIQRKSSVSFRSWYGWTPREYFCEPIETPELVHGLYPHWASDALVPLLTLASKDVILKSLRESGTTGGYLVRAFVNESDVSDWVSEDLGGLFPNFETDLPDFPQFTGVTRFVSRFLAPGRVLLRVAPTVLEVESLTELDPVTPGKLVESQESL